MSQTTIKTQAAHARIAASLAVIASTVRAMQVAAPTRKEVRYV